MNICFITDQNYIISTMTAIKSLILSNKRENLSIYVITYKLSKDECNQILKLNTKKNKITIIDASDKLIDICKEHLYVSKSALLKFYLPMIFENKDKILYLDGDVLVKGNIKTFYETDLTDNYAAVCEDMLAVIRGYAELLKHEKYFNSGVMLLNLQKMRKDNTTQKLIDYKINEIFDDFMDQNAFNKIFDEKVLYLSPTFNFLTILAQSDTPEEIAEFYRISKKELKDIQNSTTILHLAGGNKPWEDILSTNFEVYLPYLLKLPNCKIKINVIIKLFKQNQKRFIKYCLRQIPMIRRLIKVYEIGI